MGIETDSVFEVPETKMSREAELIMVAVAKLGNTRKPWRKPIQAYDLNVDRDFLQPVNLRTRDYDLIT